MNSVDTSSIAAAAASANTSIASVTSSSTLHLPVLKDVADQLQSLVDDFRRRGGLNIDYDCKQLPKKQQKQQQQIQRFSYETAAKKLAEWPTDLDRTIRSLSSALAVKSQSSELTVGFNELCRQARRSVEVDIQRVISRWIREFIESNKSDSDVSAAFDAFRAVVECFPRDSVLVHGAPPLLDATMQWLLPRAVRKCRRARTIIRQLQATQRHLVAASQNGNTRLAQQRRVADDCERILAQCRVALSDFTSQTQQSLREATRKLTASSAASSGDNDDDESGGGGIDGAQRLIDRIAMSLSKFSTGMREHLTEVTDKIMASAHSSASLSSEMPPSALLLSPNENDKNLLDDEDNSDFEHDGGGPIPIVEIEATHEEKKRELQERQHFADRSSLLQQKFQEQQQKLQEQHQQLVAQQQQRQQQQQQDVEHHRHAASKRNSIATSPIAVTHKSEEEGATAAGTASQSHSVAVQRLQLQLSEAQQLLNRSEQSHSDREAVIEQLQGNLSAMSLALEKVAGERAGDFIAEQFGGTTRRGGFQSELDMLRSQLAVQQERIVHLSSSLEERALRQAALQREVDTLRAGESVLKSELQFQAAAARAAGDELVLSQSALFQTKEMLAKCEKSRKEFADAYNRLLAISASDRAFAVSLAQQTQQMSAQLENSVHLAQVEEMLGL